MRLADFILANVEPILGEWEAFAREVWPDVAATTDPRELRDHAGAILRAAALDMQSAQSDAQQSDKSKGEGEDEAQSRRLDGASEQHGVGRVVSGFNLVELVAEYRALRASVIRLWKESRPVADRHDLDDLTRFNESIDQSLTRAVRSFTGRVDRSRQLFLAILGHDLRNPLNAIMLLTEGMKGGDIPAAESEEMLGQISASATAMAKMIADLLDFTASGLGGGMPLTRAPTDLGAVCRAVADETRAGHPGCTLRFDADGDLAGDWDVARLRQVVSNLVGNAVQHGPASCEVSLTARAEGPDVTVAVRNGGPPIPHEALSTIFDPLVRLTSPDQTKRRRPGSIGLGLYIAREVVTSHGGTIDIVSTADAGTTFTVRLPRRQLIAEAAAT